MNSPQTPTRIAIAGNPNCGKTTLFNAITGLRHKVANYPGVTVEKKEGIAQLQGVGEVTLIDLPGIYSLATHSIDEAIASKALFGKISGEPQPDLIISVIDSSNLERNLYLTSQLIDLGLPLIVALNMTDIAERRGISIKRELLSRNLDVPVLALAAHKKQGIDELLAEASKAILNPRRSSKQYAWLTDDRYRAACDEVGDLEGGSPAILVGSSLISEATPATTPSVVDRISSIRTALSGYGIDPFTYEATRRYEWINEIIRTSVTFNKPARNSISERLDKLFLHRVWGTIIFLATMAFIFHCIFSLASVPMDLIDRSFSWFGGIVGRAIPDGVLRSLIVDGIIPGVGSVLVFVPQIAMLFLFLGVLEDSGYLSRAAFLMDKIMRKVGLQGRSFIPLLSSFACAIPGIMSTRTIPSFADRMTTILIAPLMSCSARLPVFTLLIAAFVPRTYVGGVVSVQGLVLFAMYLLGIIGAAFVAWILKFIVFRGEPALFVMEMPSFRIPAFGTIFRDILDRVIIFIKNAGTVILACSVILWFLASYPKGPVRETFAGRVGVAMEPVIAPLGFNWEIGVGILASFAAREVFVSSLATVYNLEATDDATAQSLGQLLQKKRDEKTFSMPAAFSLMVFYVFACQCMSTLAVCKRETGTIRWPIFMFTYMTALAYVTSFATYHLAVRILG